MSAGSKRDEVCVQGLAVSGANGDSPRRDRGYPCCQSHQDLWPVPGCFGRVLLRLTLELGVLALGRWCPSPRFRAPPPAPLNLGAISLPSGPADARRAPHVRLHHRRHHRAVRRRLFYASPLARGWGLLREWGGCQTGLPGQGEAQGCC